MSVDGCAKVVRNGAGAAVLSCASDALERRRASAPWFD
jgi:hypothetical protein